MFKWIALPVAALGVLVSCSPYRSQDYGDFDAREKSMIIPAGNDSPLCVLRRELVKNGWKLHASHDRSSVYELGARYKLVLSYVSTDPGIRKFEVDIVDNKTGREILSAQGEDTSSGFMKKLAADIAAHTR